MTDNGIVRAAGVLRGAQRVVALTGAGVSAESGVPTFRGADGLWRSFRAEDLATPQAFERDSTLVWEWYGWRRGLLAQRAPNPAHSVLARWESRFPRFDLITQNVDGLHELAGSQKVIELHGNIWKTRCLSEGTVRQNRDVPLVEIPPRCPTCGDVVRPHIVWFGEALDPATIQAAFDASRACDVMLVIGTSSLVYPAASLPVAALESGATVIEINPNATPLTGDAHISIRGKAGELLPAIDDALG